ncbi:VanW family protein [Sphingobacterium sp. SRCM116780]|uniref:VanW family protein n=1 Tax=Sphingobacterium sp. SRCM116780 TaxID=2907623 RepID=UPI001F336EBA|nr:VanW family protein [Sphingobacterium sp. SRCM116780]UIR57531.1 VanW family protein [Sphingobacterium sp. SRCM116780]
MKTLKTLTEKHNLISETKFQLKSFLLIVRRQLQNTFADTKKFTDQQQLKSQPIISVSESNLWNINDNEQNWILTAGKVQNLRLATKRLNGVEIDANKPFSFWKHLGNPNIGQGYVLGREIREGCIVPTIAGGLCQLSNALYDAALKANFEIIERHRHTKVIKGSLAEQDRDATVKWNYLDLRFKSNHSFRIEIDLTTDKLIVKFRSIEKNSSHVVSNTNILLQASKLNDCYSCGSFECFKHPDRTSIKQEKAITTFILDDKWSEYENYIEKISTDKDFFIVPLFKNKFIKTNRYDWTVKNVKNVKAISFAAMQRALQLRIAAKMQRNIFALILRLDKKVAKVATNLIPIESTHLVISQNLLPFLWEQGVLGGRTFDVLMSRLPMEKLHQRLDIAHKQFPESKTLNDFRASQALIGLENIALTKARHIITPHQEIADTFNNKSIKLDWILPIVTRKQTSGDKILFPASALGRKGAYEMKRLAKELNLCIVLTGKVIEDNNFWDGVTTEFAGNNPFDNIRVVVYPTYVEHQPRLLLRALAADIPVITTTACGLSPTDNLTIISIGDYETLKQTVKQLIDKSSNLEQGLGEI